MKYTLLGNTDLKISRICLGTMDYALNQGINFIVLGNWVSNESPWGVMTYLKLAKLYDHPKIVTIQNPYNLLNRNY